MNRRSFLAAAAAAAFASATLRRAPEGKQRVVVVGAGLAGLSCAYELDVVASMFGAMVAPRPEQVASKLARACRPI